MIPETAEPRLRFVAVGRADGRECGHLHRSLRRALKCGRSQRSACRLVAIEPDGSRRPLTDQEVDSLFWSTDGWLSVLF